MKKTKKIISFFTLCGILSIIIASAMIAVTFIKDKKLDQIQQEALTLLEDSKGKYNENSIVLTNTNKERAEELAQILNADIRITSNGEFASLTLPEGQTVEDVYSKRENRELLKEFSLNTKVSLASLEDENENEGERPVSAPLYDVTDPDYDKQPYLNYINLQDTWAKTKGKKDNGEKITVAIIDTGIDYDHPEFIDENGNSIISEWSYNATEDKIVKNHVLENGEYDWSIVEDQDNETHGTYHGTLVAGVIAAQMNNGIGITGIAPDVELLVIKCRSDTNGNLDTADCIFGLYYAIERDANIVNMSIGGNNGEVWIDPINLAYDSDVICVASAGNSGNSTPQYPAACDKVIGVGALAENSWDKASYSNYGDWVDVFAPEANYSTTNDGYSSFSGTSSSCPIVSAVVALCLSKDPYMEFNQLYETLIASTVDIGDLGPDFYYGYGAIDVNAFLWENKGKVTFDYLTDEIESTKQIFVREHTLQNLPEPERLYMAFDGWYYDIHCEEELAYYEDAWTNDLTLYAKWINEDEGLPYTYVILEDNTVEITSYTGNRRFITVPSKIEGLEVSSVGSMCFYQNTRIRQVTLPNTLKNIKASAFSGCSYLTAITIPKSVIEIGESAFEDCGRLSLVGIPTDGDLQVIGERAFALCGSLTKIDLPLKIKEIYGSTFLGADNFKSITVPNENEYFAVENNALYTKDKEIIIYLPSSLSGTFTINSNTKEIGSNAFSYSKKTEIIIPNGVERIGLEAFMNSSILSVFIPNSLTQVSDEYFNSGKIFYKCSLLKTVVFEDNSKLTKLGQECFSGCSSLKTINFGENSMLNLIDYLAFSGCGALRSIVIPKNVTQISNGAFSGCGLQSIEFESDNLNSIGSSAFSGCSSLTQINLPDTVNSIADEAFSMTGLTSFTVGKNVKYLGAGAFAYCNSLTSLEVESGNTVYSSIDNIIYYTQNEKKILYCRANGLGGEVFIPSDVYKIDELAFAGTTISKVELNEGLNEIGNKAFTNCYNLEDIRFPESLEVIGVQAFASCTKLNDITITKNVTSIGRYAFYYDYNIKNITIEEGSKLSRIGSYVFSYTGITSFNVPASVESIASYAFEGCKELASVVFAENSKLENIAAYTFTGNDKLYSIVFEKGSSLKSIQAHGLEGLSFLSTIDLSETQLENIDNFAFRFNSILQFVELPSTLTNIGRYAFYGCKELTTLTVPATVEHIGRFAFLGAEQLDLYFESSILPPYLDENWDYGIKSYYVGVTNVVNDGDWQYAELFDGSIAILAYNGEEKEIDLTSLGYGNITQIGGYAFYGTSVEKIILPQTLTSIQRHAFAFSKIKEIEIPKTVTFIGNNAFYYTDLQSITFENDSALETIEQNAFAYCKELYTITIPNSVTTLGRSVFEESSLQEVKFEENSSLEIIPQKAFRDTKLQSVELPDSVIKVEDNAFRDNKDLSSLTFGNGNIELRSNAFYNTGLTKIHIPETVDYIGECAFVGLTELTEFTVDENNKYYSAVDGVLYNKTGTTLIAMPAGITGEWTIGENVQKIGVGAFENTALSVINFAENCNIMTLGYRAFFGATNITEITIPASVISIDYYAFANCINLKKVIFEEESNLSGLYEGAFYGCKNLSDITLPDSIVEISDYCFYGCMSLDKIPVSETAELKGIYSYAFAYTAITEIVLPETLYEIGDYAFMGLKIKSFELPDALKETILIGFGVFSDCNYIETITLPFIGDTYYNPEYTWLGALFGAGSYKANPTYVPSSLKEVIITEGVTEIGEGAFYGLTNLQKIVVPKSVTMVKEDSFESVTADYELNLIVPEGTNKINAYSEFGSLKGLRSIVLPETVTYIGEFAFVGCSSLTTINIPSSVTYIGMYAFRFCDSLKEIKIPYGITEIKERTFEQCYSLINVELPSTIEKIGTSAFAHCKNLEELTLPEGLTTIESEAFSFCGLRNIVIPSTLEHIGTEAFKYCEDMNTIKNNSDIELVLGSENNGSLAYYAQILIDKNGNETRLDSAKEFECVTTVDGFRYRKENGKYYLIAYVGKETAVTLPLNINNNDYILEGVIGVIDLIIPDGITEISEYAFYQNYTLRSVTLSNTVEKIGEYAFGGCLNLVEFSLPNSVKEIGECAFYNCNNILKLVIPNNVKVIGEHAFSGCLNLKEVTLEEGIEEISNSMFYNCHNLTVVNLPNTLKIIGKEAFRDCENLQTLKIPELVEEIGEGAFAHCEKLTIKVVKSNENFIVKDGIIYNKELTKIVFVLDNITEITIPKTITDISNAFENKETLKAVYFESGSQIKEIGVNAFWQCENLEKVTLPNTVEILNNYAFYGCTKLKEINVPTNLREIYSGVFSNCKELESFEVGDNVTSIGDSAFAGCIKLTSFTIPKGLYAIPYHIFYGSGIVSIEIFEGITRINSSAFANCQSLTNIHIPSTVNYIESNAFSGCDLLSVTIDKNNQDFTVIDNIIYDKNVTKIVFVPASVTNVIIPKTVTNLKSAFGGNKNIVSVKFEENSQLTYFDNACFTSCSNLQYVEIPEKITGFDMQAFWMCENLYEVYNKSDLKLTFGGNDNGYVAQNAKVIIDKNGNKTYRNGEYINEVIDTEEGFRFKKENNKYVLIAYLGDLDTVTLPLTINGESYTISGLRGVKNAIIPDGFTEINSGAFKDTKLESIQISETVTKIGSYAFAYCKYLKEVNIPDSVTIIENHAFYICPLTEITLPKNLKKLGISAFGWCSNLSSITIYDGLEELDERAFESTAYANNPNNWHGGGLYVGNYLVDAKNDLTSFIVREGTKLVTTNLFNNYNVKGYSIKYISIEKGQQHILTGLTNLETLVIKELGNSVPIKDYFEGYSSSVPITLKNVVIRSENGVMLPDNAFQGITDVTIYVEMTKNDTRWDENYLNWDNGNKVYYEGQWAKVETYNEKGEWLNAGYFSSSQVVRVPWLSDYVEGAYRYVFKGYDTTNDGEADVLSATIAENVTAYAIYHKESVCVQDGHSLTNCRAKAPTCTGVGYEAYVYCENCDYTTYKEISPLNHSIVHYDYKDSTCSKVGHYAYDACERCSYTTYVEIPTKPHVEIQHDFKEPTCKEAGHYTYVTCENCNYTTFEEIPKLTHSITYHTAVESTCSARGHYAYVSCENCDYTTYRAKPLLPHTKVEHEGKASTCTEKGYKPYVTCENCSYTTFEELPLSTHSEVEHEGKASTCTEKGYKPYVTCENCDYSTYEIIDENGHIFGESITVEATCEEDGRKYHICNDCSYEETISIINAKGHKESSWIIDKEATKEEKGHRYIKCLTCDKIIAEEEIPFKSILNITEDNKIIIPIAVASVSIVGASVASIIIIRKRKKIKK